MVQAKIVILGTGGTIAGQAPSPGAGVGYKAGQISVEGLLRAVPDLPAQAGGCALEAVQLAQVDSKDMDWALWRSLLRRVVDLLEDARTHAVVITHGTDTLEETAWLLQAALRPAKPVVLTCAMRPATALQADGPQNLRDAVAAAAQLGHAGGAGVWAMAAGELHAGPAVQKVHPYRLHALRSCESGPCAYMEEGVLRWVGRPAATGLAAGAEGRLAQWLSCEALPWVEILTSGAVQGGRAVQALVAAGVDGLVVAGTGNATVHGQMLEALLDARKAGVRVWCGTRCQEGVPVLPAPAANLAPAHWLGGWLVPAGVAAGVLDVIKLPPAQARVAMLLDLALQS